MALFSAITSLAKKAGTAFANTFLPSEEVAKQRRIDTFGTESKAIAATVILGTAAAAIAAPPLITSAGGSKAIISKVGTVAAANPGKTAIAVAVTPAVIGAVSSNPKTVSKTAAGLVNFEKNLYKVGRDPTVENVKNTFLENPVIATGAAAAGLIAIGGTAAGVANIISTQRNTAALKENTASLTTPAVVAGLPSTPGPSATAGPITEPITPATQVLGREAQTGYPRKAKKTKSRDNPVNSLKVQILNQNSYIAAS